MNRFFKIAIAGFAAFLSVTPVAAQSLARATPNSKPPQGWFANTKADYDFGTERIDGTEGKFSAFIKVRPDAVGRGPGIMSQFIQAEKYVGQRIRLSARLKTRDVIGLQLWMRVDSSTGSVAFDNMNDRPVTGTTDWKRYEIVLDVPKNATTVNYGFIFVGDKGAAWADSVSLDSVGKDTPLTGVVGPFPTLPSAPVNRDFDQ